MSGLPMSSLRCRAIFGRNLWATFLNPIFLLILWLLLGPQSRDSRPIRVQCPPPRLRHAQRAYAVVSASGLSVLGKGKSPAWIAVRVAGDLTRKLGLSVHQDRTLHRHVNLCVGVSSFVLEGPQTGREGRSPRAAGRRDRLGNSRNDALPLVSGLVRA